MKCYGIDRAAFNQGKNAKYPPSIDEEIEGPIVARGPAAIGILRDNLIQINCKGTTYMSQYLVRRLTPKECEFLQGFPANWTNIGDWIDSKGKKHKGEADASRYKALGNSIALPFWFEMLKKMSATYGDDYVPTMASLFDGIGGFPLCWETINGKGTCAWNSEIEEFAEAVSTKHFGDEDKEIEGDWWKIVKNAGGRRSEDNQ